MAGYFLVSLPLMVIGAVVYFVGMRRSSKVVARVGLGLTLTPALFSVLLIVTTIWGWTAD